MTGKAPGQATYEGMCAEAVKQRGGPSPFPAWGDLEDWQRKRWEAAEAASPARAEADRLRASRDRAMDALAAVKDALGWDDSRWVEWLASGNLPIPWELARTVTMIGQGPDLARDVRALAAERDEMRRRAADLNADFVKFNGANGDLADALIAASADNERLKAGITAFLDECEDGVADRAALRKLVTPGG